jgi:hypothetical protein
VQQTPYTEGFQAITEFSNSLWLELLEYGKVDEYLLRTRVPNGIRLQDGTKIAVKKHMMKYEGYFTALFKHMRSETDRYKKTADVIAFRTRNNNHIEAVLEFPFSKWEKKTAQTWVRFYDEQTLSIIKKHGVCKSRQAKQARSNEMYDLMARMVAKLDKFSNVEDAWSLVLAIYRRVLIPGTGGAEMFGISDKLLFAPAREGERCVMDFFIDALHALGIASPPQLNNAEVTHAGPNGYVKLMLK